MECDWKKSRQQRIKRDRRADKRQTAATETEPKNTNVTKQEKVPKNTNVTKQEKIKDQNGSNSADNTCKKPTDVTEVDPNFYARLKRETDDIAALKSKKPVNRQIFSSWSKLEQPIPDVEEYNQLPDFETLLCSAQGGHFRFKAEKLWDVGFSPGSYSDLFTANVDLLAAGISCIPFFKRLDLDSCLFNEEEIQTMHSSAKHNLQYYEKEKHKKKNNPVIVNNVVSFLENNSVENESCNTSQLNFKIDSTASEDLEETDMKFFKPDNFKKTFMNFEEITENLIDKIDSQKSNSDGKSIGPDSSLTQALYSDRNISSDVVQETLKNENSISLINEPKEDVSNIQKVISVENDNIDKSDASSKEDKNSSTILPDLNYTNKIKKEYSSIENPTKNESNTKDQLPITCLDNLENEIDSRMSNNNFVSQNSMKGSKIKKNISDQEDKDNLDTLLTLKGKKTMEKCELEAIVSKAGDSTTAPQCEIEDETKDQLPPIIATAKKEDLEDWLDAMLDD